MNMSSVVQPDDVLFGLRVTPKAAVLQALSEHAARRLTMDPSDIRAAMDAREALGSTGIGLGVAIPHAALRTLEEPFGMLAVLDRPVDFDAVDDTKVDIVFALLTPAERLPAHLKILSCFARKARLPEFRKSLRNAGSAEVAYQCLLREDW